ncbi:DUF177 domain-containing protein [Gemmatimonadota bacterium]
MLTIPLARLEQEGSLEIRAAIPPDHPRWEGTELRFASPLSVSGKVQWLTSGEVLARVALRGVLAHECRRCLKPLEVPMEDEFDLLFAPKEEPEEGDDGSVRLLPPGVMELDLAEAVWEEIILSQSPFAVCETDCQGFCPSCGVNLNEEQCQCVREESDPRWDALRALNKERE